MNAVGKGSLGRSKRWRECI